MYWIPKLDQRWCQSWHDLHEEQRQKGYGGSAETKMAAARPAKSDQSHSSSTYVGIGNSDLFTITRSSDLHFEVLRGGAVGCFDMLGQDG